MTKHIPEPIQNDLAPIQTILVLNEYMNSCQNCQLCELGYNKQNIKEGTGKLLRKNILIYYAKL